MKEGAVVCLAQLQYRIHKITTPASIMMKFKAARMGAFMAAAQRPSFTNFKLVTDLWVRLVLLLASFNFRLHGLCMLHPLVKYLVRFFFSVPSRLGFPAGLGRSQFTLDRWF